MTRERAIELIRSMKDDLCDFYDYDDLEALEIAISAINTIELIKSSSSFTNLQKTAIEEMMRGNP